MTVDVEVNSQQPRLSLVVRALAIWLIMIAAEITHGVARSILLVPLAGELRSNQIGVFTGSFIILAVAYVFVEWLRPSRSYDLLLVGLLWGGLTFSFELLFGRFVVGLSWERLLADYNVLAGGMMPFGMIVLGLSPLIAAKLRGIL